MNILIATYLVTSSPSSVVTYYQKLATDLAKAGLTVHIINSFHTPWLWQKGLSLLKHIIRHYGKFWTTRS